MVLVDSSHEDERALMPAGTTASQKRDEANALFLARVYPLLFHLGGARLFMASDHTPLPERLDAGLRYLTLKPNHVRAFIDEGLSFYGESSEEVRQSGNLGDKPLIVLTAGVGQSVAENELQKKLAKLSTQGKQVVVANSAHLIPLEQPQAVTNAIRNVFDSCVRPVNSR